MTAERDSDESASPMEMSCEMSPERFGVRMADAAYEAVKAENALLREVLTDVVEALGVLDHHIGLLDDERLRYERAKALLSARSGDGS